MHEHSLFQCVTQIWYFSTGNNVTELVTAYCSGQAGAKATWGLGLESANI